MKAHRLGLSFLAATAIALVGCTQPKEPVERIQSPTQQPVAPDAVTLQQPDSAVEAPVMGTSEATGEQEPTPVMETFEATGEQELSVSGPEYVLGTVIDFSMTGNSQNYTRKGWRGPETTIRWAIGEESTLCVIPLAGDGGAHLPTDLQAELKLRPFVVPGEIEAQRLTIVVNSIEVFEGSIGEEQTVRFEIAREVAFSNEHLCLTLVHPDAGIPAELLEGATDQSELAFAVGQLVISVLQ